MTKWMKNNFVAVVSIVVMIMTTCLVCGCSYLNMKFGLEDDNFLEESVEAVIEEHTGLDIDLTP